VSEWVGLKSDFLWGLGFPVMSTKIAREVGLFFKLVVLDKRLNVVGENKKNSITAAA